MKAIVFFEGKEICQVTFDKCVCTTDCDTSVSSTDFFLKDLIVGHFNADYAFMIDERKNERFYVTEADIHNLQRPCNTNNNF